MTGLPKDPRVEFVFLASQLEPSFPSGTLLNVTELGLHDIFVPGSFPANILLFIVGRLQWSTDDRDKQFQLSYQVRAWQEAAEQPALLHSDPMMIGADQPSPFPHHESGLMPAQFLSRLVIAVPRLGTFVVDVLLGDAVIASVPFAVLPP
jgi:hypothetical protein